MLKLQKFVAVVLVVAGCWGFGSLWFSTVVLGNYLADAGAFLATFAVIAPGLLVYPTYQALLLIARFDGFGSRDHTQA